MPEAVSPIPGRATRILDTITPWWLVQTDYRSEALCENYDGSRIDMVRDVMVEVEWLGFSLEFAVGVTEENWLYRLARRSGEPDNAAWADRVMTSCAAALWILGLGLIAFSVLA